jgi:NAD(P)H-dependent FMN reductase
MDDVRMLGLFAGVTTDPFGELLLRALADPGPTAVRIDLCRLPEGLPAHADPGASPLPPQVRRLRALVADADALLIALPEADGPLPQSWATALNWLGWPSADSPLPDLPTAVLTTESARSSAPRSFTSAEELLAGAGCHLVGPRTVVAHAATTLRPRPDGRVLVTDPGVMLRLLTHVHRTATAARSTTRDSGPPR